jgi:hypothetical protein
MAGENLKSNAQNSEGQGAVFEQNGVLGRSFVMTTRESKIWMVTPSIGC